MSGERAAADRIDDMTAQAVYDLLGRQNEKLVELTGEFEHRELTHLEAYELVLNRAARYRKMRGILQEIADANLRSDAGGDPDA